MRNPSFKAKKSFGQNFLRNPRILEKLVALARLTGTETVLEVGPGFGVLTERLIKKAAHVISIEKDDFLFEFVKEKFCPADGTGAKNLELIHGDALTIAPPKVPYLWVANIPYSITSPLLDHYIRENPGNLPLRAVLLVQKEVAQKLCARPPDMNVLALHVQTFGTVKLITTVKAGNFNPAPKVDSAVIEIQFHERWKEIKNLEAYFSLIHRGFSHKRKMLRSTLPSALLQKSGIDETRRPETLTIEEWRRLAGRA